MILEFSFVVRNLETGRDSSWIELHNITEEEARAAWDQTVDENFDWEIVDLECTFDINYYNFQYASFERLYEAYAILDRAAEDDRDTLIAQAMLNDGADIEDLEMLDDRTVIFASSEDSDLAYAIIDEFGGVANAVSNPDYYFDYEAFGRDLRFEGYDTDMEEEDPEYAENILKQMTDYELGVEYVDMMGGLEELGNRTIERYFDYDAYGRDLSFDYDYVSVDNIEGWVSNQ